MKNFKKILIYIAMFFGTFFTLAFLIEIITQQDLIHSVQTFIFYSMFIGWWIPLPIIISDEVI
jgi:bacteriorhodopsin